MKFLNSLDKIKRPMFQSLFLMLFLLVGVFYLSNISLFNADYDSMLSKTQNIITFVLFLLTFLLYVLLTKNKKSLFIYQPVIVLATLFVISIFVLCFAKANQTFDLEDIHHNFISIGVTFDRAEIPHAIGYTFITLAMTYVLFFVLPSHFKANKLIFVPLVLFLIAVLVTIIFSLVKESHNYLNIFKTYDSSSINYEYAAKSMFPHRNNYGHFLLLGIFASLFLHNLTKRGHWYAIAAFIYINIIFTLCKTALAIGFVAFIAYLIVRFVLTYKENKKRNIIVASIIAGFFLVILILFVSVPALRDLFNAIVTRFIGINSNLRNLIYGYSISILSPVELIFGKGEIAYSTIVGQVLVAVDLEVTSTHNGFINILGSYGIVGLIVVISLLAYCVYRIILKYREDKNAALLTAIALVSFIVVSFVEENRLFIVNNFYGLLMMFMIVIPATLSKYEEAPALEEKAKSTSVINALLLLTSMLLLTFIIIYRSSIPFAIVGSICLALLIGFYIYQSIKDKTNLFLLIPFALTFAIVFPFMWILYSYNALEMILCIYGSAFTFSVIATLTNDIFLEDYSFQIVSKSNAFLNKVFESDIKE